MDNLYKKIATTCACFHLRRASRTVTSHYDFCLSAVDLTSAQFVAILGLAILKESSISEYAKFLYSDRTTLTRIIAPLKRKKLLKVSADQSDRRIKKLNLTRQGRDVLDAAIPYWKKAQTELIGLFGESQCAALIDELSKVDRLAINSRAN